MRVIFLKKEEFVLCLYGGWGKGGENLSNGSGLEIGDQIF